MLVDLSHVIEDGLITYRGLPAPVICDHLSFDDSHDVYESGYEFQIGRIDMVANTGTYVDVPAHRFRDGDDLAAFPLAGLVSLPGVVVRCGDVGAIGADAFDGVDVEGRAVLVETGWSRHWGTDQYFDDHPYLTESAAKLLRDEGAALVGIDSVNIDNTVTGARPIHSLLLGAKIPIVEHLTNLAGLPSEGFRFSAAPPMIRGMGTFPVRAHAVLDPS